MDADPKPLLSDLIGLDVPKEGNIGNQEIKELYVEIE